MHCPAGCSEWPGCFPGHSVSSAVLGSMRAIVKAKAPPGRSPVGLGGQPRMLRTRGIWAVRGRRSSRLPHRSPPVPLPIRRDACKREFARGRTRFYSRLGEGRPDARSGSAGAPTVRVVPRRTVAGPNRGTRLSPKPGLLDPGVAAEANAPTFGPAGPGARTPAGSVCSDRTLLLSSRVAAPRWRFCARGSAGPGPGPFPPPGVPDTNPGMDPAGEPRPWPCP